MPHSQGLSNNPYSEPNQPNYPHTNQEAAGSISGTSTILQMDESILEPDHMPKLVASKVDKLIFIENPITRKLFCFNVSTNITRHLYILLTS